LNKSSRTFNTQINNNVKKDETFSPDILNKGKAKLIKGDS